MDTDINNFGRKSFVSWTRESLEAEKENQMRNYRGLTKEGKWVYGWYAEVIGYHYIIPDDADIVGITFPNLYGIINSIEVIPETIGQFTGLKDKNSKEIYEGDIIEFKSGIKSQRTVIEFEIHCYNAGFYPKGGANANHYWKVIGNIHQNPEVMEQDNG